MIEKWVACLFEGVVVDGLEIVMRMDIGRLGKSNGSLYTREGPDSRGEDRTKR